MKNYKTMFVVCKRGIIQDLVAMDSRRAKDALEWAKIHDLANHRLYHLRKIKVRVVGNPTIIGLAGKYWGYAERWTA